MFPTKFVAAFKRNMFHFQQGMAILPTGQTLYISSLLELVTGALSGLMAHPIKAVKLTLCHFVL